MATREIKKKYQIKLQMYKKQGDKAGQKDTEELQKQDMRLMETSMKEKSETGKNEIKERYNEHASQV